MKVFLPARHGLGNVLDLYFVREHGKHLLRLLRIAYYQELIEDIICFYEDFMAPDSICDLMSNLEFPVTMISTRDYPGIDLMAGDNKFPDEINGYKNLFKLKDEDFQLNDFCPIDYMRKIEIPLKSPWMDEPKKYIVFSPLAGEPGRVLHDEGIIYALKEIIRASGEDIPIIGIGKHIARNKYIDSDLLKSCDVDLTDQLNIRESLYIASRASLIISSLSWLRTCTSLFQVPVIELLENPDEKQDVIKRTSWEYEKGLYGINKLNKLNSWYKWPDENKEFSEKAKEVLKEV